MPEHALQPHVLRQRRSFDFAGDVELRGATRAQGRDCNRRIPALTDVLDVDLVDPGYGVAAVGNEQSRHGGGYDDEDQARDRADVHLGESCARAYFTLFAFT